MLPFSPVRFRIPNTPWVGCHLYEPSDTWESPLLLPLPSLTPEIHIPEILFFASQGAQRPGLVCISAWLLRIPQSPPSLCASVVFLIQKYSGEKSRLVSMFTFSPQTWGTHQVFPELVPCDWVFLGLPWEVPWSYLTDSPARHSGASLSL